MTNQPIERALAEALTIPQAAALLKIGQRTVRDAIRSGELPAFLPRGKTDPRRTGPHGGWRIWQDDLQRWYFGTTGTASR
jgi:excisionase family DNA binding protein